MVHVGHVCSDMMYYYHPYRVRKTNSRKGDIVDEWFNNDQIKIILQTGDKKDLDFLFEKAFKKNLILAKIEDKGFYEVPEGTVIMIGILCNEEQARELGLKRLRLFK